MLHNDNQTYIIFMAKINNNKDKYLNFIHTVLMQLELLKLKTAYF